MSDQDKQDAALTPAPISSIGPTATAKNNYVVFTLLLCWVVIGYLILNGDDSNSLHTSALAWAFGVQLGVIAAYLFNDASVLSRITGGGK